MPAESIKVRISGLASGFDKQELLPLLLSIRTDLETLRVFANTHLHGGVTAGAANTAVATTTISALNTQT